MKTEFIPINGYENMQGSGGRDYNNLATQDYTNSPFLQIVENMVAGMESSRENFGESILETEILGTTKEENSEEKSQEEGDISIIQNLAMLTNMLPVNIKQITDEEMKLIIETSEGKVETGKTAILNVANKVVLSSFGEAIAENETINSKANETIEGNKAMENSVTDKVKVAENKIQSDISTIQKNNINEGMAKGSSVMASNQVLEGDLKSKEVQRKDTSGLNEVLSAEKEFVRAVDIAKKQMNEQSTTKDQSTQKDQSTFKEEFALKERVVSKESTTLKEQSPVNVLSNEEAIVKPNLEFTVPVAKSVSTEMENLKLPEQIKTQMSTHIANGDKEFIMKLKPEELGEITVKMVKTGEKVTVDIMASNAKTVQLLNGELAALREVLKPMQAELRTVTCVDSGESFKQMQDFTSGQNFSNQQNKWSGNQNENTHYGSFGYPEEEAVVNEDYGRASKLKVYI